MSAAENTGFSESRTSYNSSLFHVQSIGKIFMRDAGKHTHICMHAHTRTHTQIQLELKHGSIHTLLKNNSTYEISL